MINSVFKLSLSSLSLRLEISWFVFSQAEPYFSLFFLHRFWINLKLHLLLHTTPFSLFSHPRSSSGSWSNNTNGILWDLIRFSPEDDTFPWFNPSVGIMYQGAFRIEYGNNQVRPNSPSSRHYPHTVYYMFVIPSFLTLWIYNSSFYRFSELKVTETDVWNQLLERMNNKLS